MIFYGPSLVLSDEKIQIFLQSLCHHIELLQFVPDDVPDY